VNIQPFLFGDGWIEVRDGNDTARALFDRHYSRYVYADGRKPKLFMGPGEKMVLLSPRADAVFGWCKFISRDAQQGVNCAIFRNDGPELATTLIAEAETLARRRWPGDRFYTYVDPAKVRPTMVRGLPVWGWCFFKAGWHFAGVSKSGKIIWDKVPA
jgi:hypothetical protein